MILSFFTSVLGHKFSAKISVNCKPVDNIIDKQIKIMQKKSEKLIRKNELIKIETQSLEPELEKIMYDIMKKLPVKTGDNL